MVTEQSVNKQLKKLGFKPNGWGRREVAELHNIIIPGEEIYEVVNGIYEGGFALLVATDVRVLLVDKKPLNYLTVEDLRFDMINEIDYSHRLLGAQISIATGNRNLVVRSYNQQRLRKVISHVQHCMAEAKKKQTSHQEDQNQHLEKIKEQLQTYLISQSQYQLQVQQIQQAQQAGIQPATPLPEPVRPSPELSDYLFAQSLLAQHQAQTGVSHPSLQPAQLQTAWQQPVAPALPPALPAASAASPQMNEIYSEGMQEIFGKPQPTPMVTLAVSDHSLEVNPLKVAYSKLPTLLRHRKFNRPSFHPHVPRVADPNLPKISAPTAEI